MNNFSRIGGDALKRAPTIACFLAVLALASNAAENPARVSLFPKLSVGQSISYRIGYRAETYASTESNVVAPMAPTSGKSNVQMLLQVVVQDLRLEAGKILVRLSTRISDASLPASAPASIAQSSNDSGKTEKPGKLVEFTLHADGQITDLDGLDKLSADERSAWDGWLARFAAAGVYPGKGIKVGDKWKADEPITSAILAALSWERESEYVNDAPCAPARITPQGDLASSFQPEETCAVILTTATLKQKSPVKDATPEDYKLHDLRVMGTASGKNEIISYISLKTGLVVRATEDANQSMNVIVAKSDGSNRVHYAIDAESRSQVLLLAGPASNPQQ